MIRHASTSHHVTAYARNPAKLDERPGLTVVAGKLDDTAAIQTAVTRADAVISLLGPGPDKASMALASGMQTIVERNDRAHPGQQIRGSGHHSRRAGRRCPCSGVSVERARSTSIAP